MIATLRTLHRHIWIAWIVVVSASVLLILVLQP